MKIYYYLYQITNLVNAKIYVGVHKTKSLDDGYMGSGKVICSAINKYGLDNFKKDILEFFDTSEAMYAREKEVVTADFLLREDTYNLRRGGHGGFDYINTIATSQDKSEAGKLGRQVGINNKTVKIGFTNEETAKGKRVLADKIKNDPIFAEKCRQIWAKARIEVLSEKTKIKRKQTFVDIKHQQGTQNSQFGTMWITNGTENKKIKRDIIIPEGWNKGRSSLK